MSRRSRILKRTTVAACIGAALAGGPCYAEVFDSPRNTILPTDVVPLPASSERTSFGEDMQLRIFQKLPARLFLTGTTETSIRLETNVFQSQMKRTVLNRILQGHSFSELSQSDQLAVQRLIDTVSQFDEVYRIFPNLTAGWAFTPRTSVYANYFLIRDSLFHHVRLNSLINQFGLNLQHNIPIGKEGDQLQLTATGRELWQSRQHPVFDWMPQATYIHPVTPNLSVYLSALVQLRSKQFIQGANREIDPFYTAGFYLRRGRWAFSNSVTFLQNYREPFGVQSQLPVNSSGFICDFEIDRQLFRQMPGFQAFVRAEPVYNFASKNTPGLSGNDFRLYWGLRMTLAKPQFSDTMGQLKQYFQQQEQERQKQQQQQQQPQPNSPGITEPEKKNSAYLNPYEVTASSSQPIHGPLPEDGSPSETAEQQTVSTVCDTAADTAM